MKFPLITQCLIQLFCRRGFPLLLLVLVANQTHAQYPFEAELPISVDRMLADPIRPRVYALTLAANTVRVINTDTFTVTKTITVGSEPRGMAIAADNSKLYIAESGSTTQGLAVINLSTFTVSYITTPIPCYSVAVGLDDHLYLTSPTYDFIDYRLNDGTWKQITGGGNSGDVVVSPDRKTLFRADTDSTPAQIDAFDVSGPDPVLRESISGLDVGGRIILNHDGTIVSFPAIYSSPLYSGADLNVLLKNFSIDDGYAHNSAFSPDNSKFFQELETEWSIEVFNPVTFARIGAIHVGGPLFGDMVTDTTGKHLFVADRKSTRLNSSHQI